MMNWGAVKFRECVVCGSELKEIAADADRWEWEKMAGDKLCEQCMRSARNSVHKRSHRTNVTRLNDLNEPYHRARRCDKPTCGQAWEGFTDLLFTLNYDHPEKERMFETEFLGWLAANLDRASKSRRAA